MREHRMTELGEGLHDKFQKAAGYLQHQFQYAGQCHRQQFQYFAHHIAQNFHKGINQAIEPVKAQEETED